MEHKAAVSTLRIVLPREMLIQLLLRAKRYSCSVKSPSGPIKKAIFCGFLFFSKESRMFCVAPIRLGIKITVSFIKFLTVSSRLDIRVIVGTVERFDCFAAL